MSGEPEISVVVATRDRASRLGDLLRSLRAQTVGGEAFEVIVVDDASVDATPAVLAREAAARELELQVVRRERSGGPGASRNAGWQQARGDLIAFIDDDCVAAPGWLEAGRSASRERPGCFVQGRTDPDPAERDRLGPFAYTIRVEQLGPHYETCNIFYPRALLERLGGFDSAAFPGGGEDCDLAWRAIESGFSATFAPEALVYHAVHRVGPVGQLRRAAHWTPTMLVFARHRGMRDAYLHRGIFWQVTHWMLLRAMLAMLLPRRLRALTPFLVAPYLTHLRQRLAADGGNPLFILYYPVHDVVEMAAVVRGAVRYRTLLI